MPADHDVEARDGRVKIKLLDIVQDIDGCRAGFGGGGQRQLGGPFAMVDIAPDGDHRSQCPQGVEDFRFAYIAGMDDEIRAIERAQRFGAQQTVGVGDQPYDGDKVPPLLPLVTSLLRKATSRAVGSSAARCYNRA